MSDRVKLCRDCKHVRVPRFWWLIGRKYTFAKCAAVRIPTNALEALVTGDRERMAPAYCSVARLWKCGQNATLYEASAHD